ncbi:MAG: TonB-dependent receptor [Parasphingorhabdus sp.]|nr:TonB-dependent receptor [Parasphingorhabdus sp.]
MASSYGRRQFSTLLLGSVAFAAIASSSQATAQENAAPQESSEADEGVIIVTARKRDERLIDVPVAITAVSGDDLSRSGINGTDALARKIPGLVVGEGGGTVQGGSLSLRGISAADSNPLGDQAVSFNIDGVQVARSSVRRMGDFDIAGVEVLKGPQALFFGKNSPGGIISTRTADPTDQFEVGGKLGYEFNADELRGEGYISGPLTDGLGARLAVYGSTMKGWVKNIVPETDPFFGGSRTPESDEIAFRGTLKFDNGGPFRARFKLSYNDVVGNSSSGNIQTVDCPSGTPTTGGPVDCTGDDRIVLASLGPDMAKITALAGPLATTSNPAGNPKLPYSSFGDGSLYSHSKQWLSGLELNYDLADDVTITSVTGFYKLSFFNRANYTATSRPDAILGSVNFLDIREISQELRVASSFSGPINFLVGGQYQDTSAISASLAAFGAIAGQPSLFGAARPSPFVVSNYYLDQDGKAYSFFGQVQVKPIPEIEIAAGGRYSHEEKELISVVNRATELVGAQPFLSNGGNKKTFNNFSPEISISYRPTSDLNIYANYKQGFLSGGFNGGSFNAAGDFSYRPQKVKGFEGGIKSRLFDGMVSADLALYSYKIDDLQVQVTTQGTIQELKNAGKVSSKGAEFSLTVRPTTGLSLYGNLAYADAKYDQYYASCYIGQLALSPGTGIGQCASQPNPTNDNIVGVLQNLSGTQLIRSPEWSGNAGFVYETPLTDSTKIEFASGISFSDSYVTSASSQPRSRSPHYTLLDASVRVAEIDDKWELALIGRNLTDKYYWARATDNPAASVNPNQLADQHASVSRGREVMLRVGFKF